MTGATIADRRLHPGTMLVRMAKDLPSTALGLPAFMAIVADAGWQIVLPTAAAAIAATLLINWLLWRRFRYGIGSGDLVIESGLLSRTRRSIPFERIQDVDIERGPLHRLLALAKVRIETGGSGSDEGVLDSVTLDEAGRLRGAIRAGRVGQAAEPAASEEARPVFAMDLRRVLLAGLFNFSFLYLAGLYAVLQAFEPWLPFDIYDPARWLGFVEGRVAGLASVGAASFLLIVAILLGVATGVTRTVSRDYGFRLHAEPERFRRERGLFTRSEVVIPKRRVQVALSRTGPLRRWLGWHQLLFQTLSAGKGDAGHQSIAPFATTDEIETVIAEAAPFRLPETRELIIVSSGFIWRRMVGAVLVPVLAILVATFFFPPAIFFLTLLPLFAVQPFVERRFHRYGLADKLLFVRRGVWRQRLWVVPVANIQATSLSRSWLQRRLGIATVLIDTAGAPLLESLRISDLRFSIARRLVRALRHPSGSAPAAPRTG